MNGRARRDPAGLPAGAGEPAGGSTRGRLRRTLVLGQRGYQRIKVATTMPGAAKVNIRTTHDYVSGFLDCGSQVSDRHILRGTVGLYETSIIALAAPDSSVAGVMMTSEVR